jgi:hypothetical protein
MQRIKDTSALDKIPNGFIEQVFSARAICSTKGMDNMQLLDLMRHMCSVGNRPAHIQSKRASDSKGLTQATLKP